MGEEQEEEERRKSRIEKGWIRRREGFDGKGKSKKRRRKGRQMRRVGVEKGKDGG